MNTHHTCVVYMARDIFLLRFTSHTHTHRTLECHTIHAMHGSNKIQVTCIGSEEGQRHPCIGQQASMYTCVYNVASFILLHVTCTGSPVAAIAIVTASRLMCHATYSEEKEDEAEKKNIFGQSVFCPWSCWYWTIYVCVPVCVCVLLHCMRFFLPFFLPCSE